MHKGGHALPEAFRELERFADWEHPDELGRRQSRLARPMEEIQSFYDALLPRMEGIIEHLNRFPMNDLPPSESRLYQLALSWIDVTSSVELYKQPGIVEGIDVARFRRVD